MVRSTNEAACWSLRLSWGRSFEVIQTVAIFQFLLWHRSQLPQKLYLLNLLGSTKEADDKAACWSLRLFWRKSFKVIQNFAAPYSRVFNCFSAISKFRMNCYRSFKTKLTLSIILGGKFLHRERVSTLRGSFKVILFSCIATSKFPLCHQSELPQKL